MNMTNFLFLFCWLFFSVAVLLVASDKYLCAMASGVIPNGSHERGWEPKTQWKRTQRASRTPERSLRQVRLNRLPNILRSLNVFGRIPFFLRILSFLIKSTCAAVLVSVLRNIFSLSAAAADANNFKI